MLNTMLQDFNIIQTSFGGAVRIADGRVVCPLGEQVELPIGWMDITDATPTDIMFTTMGDDYVGLKTSDNDIFSHICSLCEQLNINVFAVSELPTQYGGYVLFDKHSTDDALIKAIGTLDDVDLLIDNSTVLLPSEHNKSNMLLSDNVIELDAIPDKLFTSLFTMGTIVYNITVDTHMQPLHGFILASDLSIRGKLEVMQVENIDTIHVDNHEVWLTELSDILINDVTVKPKIYVDFMYSVFKELRNTKMNDDGFIAMLTSQVHSGNFRYAKGWKKDGAVCENHLHQCLKVFRVPEAETYLVYNTNTDEILFFDKQTRLSSFIKMSTDVKKDITKFIGSSIIVKVIDSPSKRLRLYRDPKTLQYVFNIFKPTKAWYIIKNSIKPERYVKPSSILSYLKELIPNKNDRVQFMQFLAHKHSNDIHIPLYFGISGEQSDMLVNIILPYLSDASRVVYGDLSTFTKDDLYDLTSLDYVVVNEPVLGYDFKTYHKIVHNIRSTVMNPYISAKYVVSEHYDKYSYRSDRFKHSTTIIINTDINGKLIDTAGISDKNLVIFNGDVGLYDEGMIIDELDCFAYYLSTLPKPDARVFKSNSMWSSSTAMGNCRNETKALVDAVTSYDLKGFINVLLRNNISKQHIDHLFIPSDDGYGAKLITSTDARSICTTRVKTLYELINDNDAFDDNTLEMLKPVTFRDEVSIPAYKLSVNRKTGLDGKFNVMQFDDIYIPFYKIKKRY